MARHAVAPATTDTVLPANLEGQVILSAKQTRALTSLSTMTLHRLRRAGDFPAPVRLSPGRLGWRRCEVEQWLADRQEVGYYLRPSPNPKARPRPAKVNDPAPRRPR